MFYLMTHSTHLMVVNILKRQGSYTCSLTKFQDVSRNVIFLIPGTLHKEYQWIIILKWKKYKYVKLSMFKRKEKITNKKKERIFRKEKHYKSKYY